jgi:hypothetical protein
MLSLAALKPGETVVGLGCGDALPRLNLYKTYFLYSAPLRLQTPARHQWAESSRMPWETGQSPSSAASQ